MPHHHKLGSTAPPLQPDKVRYYDMAFCPFSMRVRLLLEHHKFNYDQIFVSTASKPEWFLNDFPKGIVPAIIIKGENGEWEKMVDSEAISLHLDHVRDKNLSPRSLVEVSGQKTLDELKAWWSKVFSSFYAAGFSLDVTDEQKKTYFDGMEEFESLIKGNPFISGSEVGFADFYVYPLLDRMEPIYRIVGKEMPKEEDWPLSYKWLKAMRELEAVKNHRISAQRHYDYILSARANDRNFDI